MFESIRLKRFKAYRNSGEIPLRPLTIVLGANNSGKSSILHALLALAQTLEDTTSRQALVTSGAYVDLGGFYDILWGGGKADSADSFGIELTASGSSLEPGFYSQDEPDENKPTRLAVNFAFDSERNAIVVSSASVSDANGRIHSSGRRSGRGYSSPSIPEDLRSELTLDFRHFFPVLQPSGTSRDARRLAMDTYFMAESAWFAWRRALSDVAHVAPLRQPVPRFGILGKSPTSELGPGGENLLRVLRASDDGQTERLADEVSRWVSDVFEMLQALRLVDVDESGTVLALLGDERAGFDNINVANMGEGISQLLPIIARVLTTRPGGALLIEQPELHLHPAAQADLADLFIAGALTGGRQYIVETHSEHLVLRLRRRIAEGTLRPDQVSILYVERDGKSSTVRPLDLNNEGNFDDWPEGFFEERYREALAIVAAVQARGS